MHYVPNLSAECRLLFMLAKLVAQLACSVRSPRRASLIAARVDSLVSREPICAAAIFDAENLTTWQRTPPELKEMVLELPCTLRKKPYQYCVMRQGGLRRFRDRLARSGDFVDYRALPPLGAE